MSDRDILDVLAEELSVALQPLTAALTSQPAMRDFLEDLGWDYTAAPGALEALRAPAEQVFTLANGAGEVGAADVGRLLNGVRAAFNAVSDLESGGGLAADFRNEFPRQLIDYLLVEYLLGRQARWGYILLVLGIIRLDDVPAAGGRAPYLRRVVDFEGLGQFFNDPLAFVRNSYHWGESDFDGERVLRNLAGLLEAWDLEGRVELVDPQTLAQLNAGSLQPEQAFDTMLRLVLFESGNDVAGFSAGFGMFVLPETAADKPGLALLPFVAGEFDEELSLTDQLTLRLQSAIDVTGGAAILVHPGRDVEFLLGFNSGTPSTASGNLAVILRLANPDAAFMLLGSPGASRFEVAGVSTTGGTRFHSNGKFEVFVEFALESGKIVIQPAPEDRDGFLGQLLPENGMEIKADLSVGFSSTQGLYFGGSGGLEISIPAHIQLGPIEIDSALLGVKFKDGAIPLEFAATIKGDLSVMKVVVENIGARAVFTFPPDRKGNLGPLNLGMEFRPPNGVGLSIDAGAVKGGGYLFFDPEKGEYAGALELTVSNFLSLKAIGLINTKLPGGQPGFSLLVIITAEFSPGYQLGFGFVLLGVGGLLGLNRVLLLDPLLQGVRSGAINSILFPTNVVANAPKFLSDLRAIFPPQEGTFLIGPMAKIGWGTPTLISISLGVMIEIPGDVVILGRLRVALPTDDDPVLVLQVSFVGALEFDKKRIWFFATMYESRVLFITLEGEMGLLMDFSDNPNFVLSVGGFHPRFTPPPLPFPSLKRVTLSLVNESWARVRADTYFAVTSNSVQMGVHAEAFFGFDALSVEGEYAFDALLRFSPVYLIVEISSGFSVKVFGVGVFGVHLQGTLEGPAPWHIRGSAEIDLLFFSISVDVNVTFGVSLADLLLPIGVLPQLLAEFEKLESWRATLPPFGQLFVSLRDLGNAGVLVLHPVGTLQITQRFAPLNLRLDKIGNQKPSDVNSVTVAVQAGALSVIGPTREKFAAAQYRDMDDAAKLSAPAYEPLESGVELGASGLPWATGPLAQRNVRYETIIVDTAFERHRIRFFKFWDGLFVHFRAGSSVSRSPVSISSQRRMQPFAGRIALGEQQYTVAFQSDNRPRTQNATFMSYAEASEHLDEATRLDPSLFNTIHVIPMAEVNQN